MENPSISKIYDLCKKDRVRIVGLDPCIHYDVGHTQILDIYEMGKPLHTWLSCANCFLASRKEGIVYYVFTQNGKSIHVETLKHQEVCKSCEFPSTHIDMCVICNKHVCTNCGKWDQDILIHGECQDKCPHCDKEGLYDDTVFVCDDCGSEICRNCIAITGCQTTQCTCKQCFDGWCTSCHNVKVDFSRVDGLFFLDDGDVEHRPICDKCLEKSK